MQQQSLEWKVRDHQFYATLKNHVLEDPGSQIGKAHKDSLPLRVESESVGAEEGLE